MEFTDVRTAFRMQEKGKAVFYKLCPTDEDIEYYWTGRVDKWNEKEKSEINMVNMGIEDLSEITGIDFTAKYSEDYSAMFFITKGIRFMSHFSLPCFLKGEIPDRFKINKPHFLETEARLV